MEELIVVKIGGNIIDDDERLRSFLKSFAALRGNKILVHGGGKIATEIGYKMGIEPKYNDGRRITDKDTLALVTKVYGGLVSKNVVALLQANGCNAIGLTGADGNVIQAYKREVKDVDYGYVGDIAAGGVNQRTITALLQAGLVPVFAPLTHDGNGTMLNTNADTIAQEVAKALSVGYTTKLIYCFEKKGVLKDVDDDNSVIPHISKEDFEKMVAEQTIFEGMIPKLHNALTAVEHGVSGVLIGKAENLEQLAAGNAGTLIK